MLRRFFVFLLLLLSFSVVSAQGTTTLTVFAASSLTDALTEIEAGFEVANPGVDVVYSFDNSSVLANQIIEGAPVDVFASAAPGPMANVRDAGVIEGRARTFVKNRLAILIPASNPANIQSFADIGNAGVRLIVVAENSPVRGYTNMMLARAGADPRFGQAFVDAVNGNIVSEEANVRQAVARLTLGEADAAILYYSDLTPDVAGQVTIVEIPGQFNIVATYPIAALNVSANLDLAQAYVDYVLLPEAQEVFVNWGLLPITLPELPTNVTIPTDGLLHVEGMLYFPLTLSEDDLRNNYGAYTVDVSFLVGEETVTAAFTGALLIDVLNSGLVNINADLPNDLISLYVVATGANGLQAAVSWGEISPNFANNQILVAYEMNGAPPPEGEGPLRLVVPGDTRNARYVPNLVSLVLFDAPRPG